MMMKTINLIMPLLFLICHLAPNITFSQTCNEVDDIWIDSNQSTANTRTFVWNHITSSTGYSTDVYLNSVLVTSGIYSTNGVIVTYTVIFPSTLITGDLIEISVRTNCGINFSNTVNETFYATDNIAVELVIPEDMPFYNETDEWKGYCRFNTYQHYWLSYRFPPNANEAEGILSKLDFLAVLNNTQSTTNEELFDELIHSARLTGFPDPVCDPTLRSDKWEKRLSKNVETVIFPNPCTEKSVVTFALEKESIVNISVLNIEGSIIKTLVKNEKLISGNHNIPLSNSGLEIGIYKVLVKINDQLETLSLLITE